MLTFYKLFNDNKENWRPNCSNSFSLNIAELIAHLNGEKKIIYWLHFVNLPPLKQLQQIFVLYEAKVMIYWQKNYKKFQNIGNKLIVWAHGRPKKTIYSFFRCQYLAELIAHFVNGAKKTIYWYKFIYWEKQSSF